MITTNKDDLTTSASTKLLYLMFKQCLSTDREEALFPEWPETSAAASDEEKSFQAILGYTCNLYDKLIKFLQYCNRSIFRMTVTISTKFQLVIPKSVREALGVRSGMKCQVVVNGNHIELIPLRPMRELRGIVKGMNTDIDREDDRL